MNVPPRYARLRLAILTVLVAAVAVAAYVTRPKDYRQTRDGADEQVTTMGRFEVTAELVEIRGLEKYRGTFPSNDLGYDYAYVLEYLVLETHRGKIDGDTLFVAHYNPLKPRCEVADADIPGCRELGGDLERIRLGDLHRMALEAPLEDHCMVGVINPYARLVDPQSLYWAVWTNRVIR